jgi:LPXTG-site transpeptidase (sortase) family protein
MIRIRHLALTILVLLVTGSAVDVPTDASPVPDPPTSDDTEPASAPTESVPAASPREDAAPRTSARLADHAARSSATPTSLRIPAIEVDAPIRGVGTDAAGDLEVIDDVEHVGWYRHGPSPGDDGSAVLAAHVDTAKEGPGVFFDLARVAVGDQLEVVLDDGTTATFVVDGLTRHAKADLPVDEIFSREGPPRVVLITCGGEFDTSRRSYSDNVVVTATQADE